MQYGQWIGRAALALIFLFNALGVVDQTRPANELAAHGAPAALVPALIAGGRALQPVAGTALVIGWHERVAALALAHGMPTRSPVREQAADHLAWYLVTEDRAGDAARVVVSSDDGATCAGRRVRRRKS